ncbi:MAG: FG-GAP-like repeat-containing protein [Bacteroidetes bacterium]|nr:FG-GAP-like repeat-containing protein [Bacteroidota bacterium]
MKSFILITGFLAFTLSTHAQIWYNHVLPSQSGIAWPSVYNTSQGFAWGDFNNDGILDLFISNGQDTCRLFIGNGDSTFTRAFSAGLTTLQIQNQPGNFNVVLGGSANTSYGSLWADFDGDGLQDLLFTNGSGSPSFRIFKNNGNMTFSDITGTLGLTYSHGGNPIMPAVADFDRDGDLDMAFAGTWLTTRTQVRFLRNDNGTYNEVGASLLGSVQAAASNPAWIDVNNDGWLDLWMPDDNNSGTQTSRIYINNQNGTFTLSDNNTNGLGNIAGGSSAWGDLNNDGNIDLVTCGLGSSAPTDGPRVCLNNGSGVFTVLTPSATGLPNNSSQVRGLCLGDYDNDGKLDLLITWGTTVTGIAPPFTQLFKGAGNGTFTNVTSAVNAGNNYNPGGGRSVLFIDYDNDGFLDIFHSVSGGPKYLFHNIHTASTNNWIGFKRFDYSKPTYQYNRSAIGAKIRVVAKLDGVNPVSQIRYVEAGGTGGQTGGNMWLHFGLGQATVVDSVIAYWPDGTIEIQTNVPVNQYYEPPTQLPAQVTSFTASFVGTVVVLKWNTVTEVGNFGFDIERKSITQSSTWQKIGFVQGAGTSNAPREYTFTDNAVRSGKYAYRLKQIDLDGSFKYLDEIEIDLGTPTEYVLYQNYPNPFNPSTVITFALPTDGPVRIVLMNVLGEHVKELVHKHFSAGIHEIPFDATGLASGIYFYKMEANGVSLIKKLMLLK